jgi:hypothetical protein
MEAELRDELVADESYEYVADDAEDRSRRLARSGQPSGDQTDQHYERSVMFASPFLRRLRSASL